MEFRKAVQADKYRIMEIIQKAQEYFKNNGIDQWQDGYPNYKTLEEDIENGHGYVLSKHNIIVATVALIFDGEETYDSIYDGRWLSDGQYTTIHRVGVDPNYKGSGLASIMLKDIEKLSLKKGIRSIKADTHQDNMPMVRFLEKNEFKPCGKIYLNDGSKRIAFEKIL